MTTPHLEVHDARRWRVEEGEWRAHVRALPPVRGVPGMVSRSYRYPWAVVASHGLPMGVDIEMLDAVAADDLAFAETICTPDELARFRDGGSAELVDLWSGKEALAKALGDPLSHDPRRLEAPAGWEPAAGDGLRSRGIWLARRLPLTGEPGGSCLGWMVWQNPETCPDLRERPV